MLKLSLIILCAVFAANDALPGGKTKLTSKEIEADEILPAIFRVIADGYNKRSNSLYAFKVGKNYEEMEISKQVVAGLKYYITLKMVQTECKKNTDKYLKQDLEKCEISSNGRPQMCTFEVLYRPWMILGVPSPITYKFKGCK
eukprot:gene7085-7885_t